MRTTHLAALFLTVCTALAMMDPPTGGGNSTCAAVGYCSAGGPIDKGKSCTDLKCCSNQKTGAGNGRTGTAPLFTSKPTYNGHNASIKLQ
ncbi:hypothetical protein DHEL01_v202946 [Diaporthe helianthi]|uniref:Uncharacterized protein n=1 Tax=Diaporthe helianthi TaxID=158607 RepID=A0A2P5I837_DIAHE|nr:hypothetical protein DHEL01_v202946 [Diaporthe helianthi]